MSKAKSKEIEAVREAMQDMCDEIIGDDETDTDFSGMSDADSTVKVASAKKNGAIHGDPRLPAQGRGTARYSQGFLSKYT